MYCGFTKHSLDYWVYIYRKKVEKSSKAINLCILSWYI